VLASSSSGIGSEFDDVDARSWEPPTSSSSTGGINTGNSSSTADDGIADASSTDHLAGSSETNSTSLSSSGAASGLATSTGSSVPVVQRVSFRVRQKLADIMAEFDAYVTLLKQDLHESLDIPPARVTDVHFTEGGDQSLNRTRVGRMLADDTFTPSTLVSFVLLPSSISSDPTPAQLGGAIVRAAADSGSVFRARMFTGQIVGAVSTASEEAVSCADDSIALGGQECPARQESWPLV
jgi:hypothetical protein